MLQASRSTGNARGTMKPPGIKRSTLFRARDTCSSSRRLGSRITVSDLENKRVNNDKAVNDNSRLRVKQRNCESSAGVRNITGGNVCQKTENFCSQTEANEAAKVLVNSESKIHLASGQVLEDFEEISRCCWEWKVDEVPKRSTAMSKLRCLRQQRNDVLSELRSSLENLLNVVRNMRNQRSR